MNMIKRIVVAAIVVAVIGGVVYWRAFSPVAVSAYRVDRRDVLAEVMGTGTLEAKIQTSISPKISGRISSLHCDQGDRVQAGDLLVELNDRELEEQVAIAQASVDIAQSAINRLQAERARAEAVLKQAESSHDRNLQLVRQNAVSQDEVDKSGEALGIAIASLDAAEAAIIEGQKQLISAEETLHYHQARLSDTRIVAPFDGLITRRRREVGDVVIPGTTILTLISEEELWISAWVDETELGRVHLDQPARVVFRSEPDQLFPGSVARIGKETDRETREFVVDVQVHQLPNNWAMGQRAEVYLEAHRADHALAVPLEYIQWSGEVPSVFVLESGRARRQTIEIAVRGREYLAVKSGLDESDVVLRPGEPGQLRDGRRVREVADRFTAEEDSP